MGEKTFKFPTIFFFFFFLKEFVFVSCGKAPKHIWTNHTKEGQCPWMHASIKSLAISTTMGRSKGRAT